MSTPLHGEIIPPSGQPFKDEAKVRRNFWTTLRRAARQIPFTEDLIAAYYCAMDPASPLRVRATLLGALAYFVLPIDAVPDLLLGIGFSDDAAVLASAIAMVAMHISPRHREMARAALNDQ